MSRDTECFKYIKHQVYLTTVLLAMRPFQPPWASGHHKPHPVPAQVSRQIPPWRWLWDSSWTYCCTQLPSIIKTSLKGVQCRGSNRASNHTREIHIFLAIFLTQKLEDAKGFKRSTWDPSQICKNSNNTAQHAYPSPDGCPLFTQAHTFKCPQRPSQVPSDWAVTSSSPAPGQNSGWYKDTELLAGCFPPCRV